jgi:hypothetical protein
MPLPPLAAKLQDSLLCGLWPNRRAIYQGHRSLCRTTEDSPRAVQEGTRQRGTGSPVFASRSESGPGSRRPDRNGPRESLGLALLAKGQEKAVHPHMDWGRQMAYPNHFYFYLWDAEWGATFCKTNAYAPFPIWLWLNGHEWAKRQLEKAGIRYEALDNGFRSCADPVRLQKICDSLGAAEVRSFLARWLLRLPSPFTPTEHQGDYGYELAFRQLEVSETCVCIEEAPRCRAIRWPGAVAPEERLASREVPRICGGF